MQIKLCKYCKYHFINDEGDYFCSWPGVDLVTGKDRPSDQWQDCAWMRYFDRPCGPEGILWTRKVYKGVINETSS